jgi:hypothetical protein
MMATSTRAMVGQIIHDYHEHLIAELDDGPFYQLQHRSGRGRPLLGEPALGLAELIERLNASLGAEGGVHVGHTKEHRLRGDNGHWSALAVCRREYLDLAKEPPDLCGAGIPITKRKSTNVPYAQAPSAA